jgi:hypothetical protein
MEWLDYCEHCGTTDLPRRVINVKASLEGRIRGDEKEEKRQLSVGTIEEQWVCSKCGRIVRQPKKDDT